MAQADPQPPDSARRHRRSAIAGVLFTRHFSHQIYLQTIPQMDLQLSKAKFKGAIQ
jgi:hypothetical protein